MKPEAIGVADPFSGAPEGNFSAPRRAQIRRNRFARLAAARIFA